MLLLWSFLALFQAPTAPASSSTVARDQSPAIVEGAGAPGFRVPRIVEPVVVDGRLNEPAWERATLLAGFSEYRPVDGQRASERTEVRVWYSPTALYFGIIAYDSSPGSVRATVADRDNLDRDDSVRIFLDTFNDRRRAFVFGVNPLGVQEDGVQTEGAANAGRAFGMGASVDLSPDYQFESKGMLTADGYVVEVRIPFKSLRYPNVDGAKWGLNILRKTQRTGREDTWTDARRQTSFLAQAGAIEGLTDLERGVVVEAQPFVTASSNGVRGADGRFTRDSNEVNPGANVRLGFTNVSLDATVNPDFSQVEADAGQVTQNERFALFYPEKRPFFLEGIELFSTPNQLVYTRRIVDPIGGGKVTGKVGRTGLAFLSAADEVGDPRAWVNIARVRQDIGTDSLLGLTYTDRASSLGSNRVASADARIVFKRVYYVLGQVGESWTEAGGLSRRSPIWQGEFDRTGRAWGFNYRLTGIGESFEAQSGFVPRNNIVEARAFNRISAYGSRGALLESLSVFFGPTRIWRYSDFGKAGALEGTDSVNITAQLRGGWALSARPALDFVHFDPTAYRAYVVLTPSGPEPFVVPDKVSNFGGTYSVTTPILQKINARVEVRLGGTAIFAEASDGHETRVTSSLGLRPTTSVRVEASLITARLWRDVDDSEFARSTIPRLKFEYQPRRSLFVRVVTEYRSESRARLLDPVTGAPLLVAGQVAGPVSFRGLRTDLLFSFEPTPGTVAFFGYGAGLEQNPAVYGTRDFERSTDGFFVKLAYQFRR